MTKFQDDEVIEFVLKNHDDFEDNECPENIVPEIACMNFKEWKNRIGEYNDFKMNPLIKKYFDFKQLLKDEWKYSACMGGDEYYLVRETLDGKLEFIYEENFDDYVENCRIVTIPTY